MLCLRKLEKTTQVSGSFGPWNSWIEAPSWIGNPLVSLGKVFIAED
jgi:hypothetical protein